MAKVNVHHADRHDSIRAPQGSSRRAAGENSEQGKARGSKASKSSATARAPRQRGKPEPLAPSASAVYIEIDGKRFTIDATLLADSTDGDKHRTTLTRRMSGKSVVVLLLGLGAAYSRLDEAYNALAAYIKRLCGLPVSSKRQPNVSRRQASARRGKAKK